MHFLDCKGQVCPGPVIETKKVLDESHPDLIEIAVDNATSRENVSRFLTSRGYAVEVEEREGETIVVGRKVSDKTDETATKQKRIVIFIASSTMGRGDDVLGAILMKSFVHTIKDLDPLPWRIVLANSGVRLATAGAETLPQLQELEGLGVEVLSCGTCLDYYSLKDQLQVGRVSNMFEIMSSLVEGTNILKP